MLTRRELFCGGAGLALGDTLPRAKTTVAIVRHDDHLVAFERALDLAGGLGGIGAGDRVLIKVNTNSDDPYPYSSSPAAVGWLCRWLGARGARVVVGDRSFWGDRDTAGNLERNGIAPAARAAGATVEVLESIDWVEIPAELVPSWKPPVRVPRVALEASALVNLACLKTHFISGSTLALKNFLGLVHAEDRARPGNLRSHDRDLIHHQVAEIHRYVRAAVHVIDGHRALLAGGPTPGSGAEPVLRDLRVVVAARDPIAAEVAGVALLRRHAEAGEAVRQSPVWQSPTVAAAVAAGVGAQRHADLDVRREGVRADELELG